MNWQQIEVHWSQVTEKILSKWGKLSEPELANIAGHRDRLIVSLTSRYKWGLAETEKKVDEFVSELNVEMFSDHATLVETDSKAKVVTHG